MPHRTAPDCNRPEGIDGRWTRRTEKAGRGSAARRGAACVSAALVLSAVLLAVSTPASALTANLFVNQAAANCSDSGTGTSSQPYCTIKRAAAVAAAGQTVLVSSGTYGGDVAVAKSGTSSAPIVFQNAPGATVTVTGGTNGFKVAGKSWITIKGFTVNRSTSVGVFVSTASRVTLDGNDVSAAGQRVSGEISTGIKLTATSSSVVIRNTTHDNSDHGLYLTGGSTGNEITGNLTYGNARGISRAAAGIFLSGSPGNTINGNHSRNNEDTGIGLWDSANGNIVSNNVVSNNGDHGIDILRSTGETVVANTVYKNVDSGIELQGSAGAVLNNNISVDNGINSPRTSGNIRVVDPGSANLTTLEHDLLFLSSGTNLIDYLGTRYSTLSAFQAARGKELQGRQGDPKFKNAAAGDLHLLAGSPAVDSANSAAPSQPTTDADGLARVDDPTTANTGAGPRSYDDRGAYELAVAANRAPVAVNDTATTPQDTAVKVPVLVNDSDPDNDPLTVTNTSVPAHGTATVNADNTVTFSPMTGYSDPDSFTYTISDGRGATASATVSMNVTGSSNLIGNSGFEVNTSGWSVGASSTSLTRIAGGHTGNFAAQLTNSTAGAQCTLDDKPNWVPLTSSGPYTVGLWVRSDAPGANFKLRVREYNAGTLVGSVSTTVTLTSTWQLVSMVYTPVAAGQSNLDLQGYTSAAPVGPCFQADDATITH